MQSSLILYPDYIQNAYTYTNLKQIIHLFKLKKVYKSYSSILMCKKTQKYNAMHQQVIHLYIGYIIVAAPALTIQCHTLEQVEKRKHTNLLIKPNRAR